MEVDRENPRKDIDALDIALPRLPRRFSRDFKDLAALDVSAFGHPPIPLKAFSAEETREIVFKRMLDGKIDHVVQLDGADGSDYRAVIAFFARLLMQELRLVGATTCCTGR